VGAVAEILAVELAGPVPGVVRGCYLDAPKPGTRAEGQALDVMGWAVGDQGPVEAVEFWMVTQSSGGSRSTCHVRT